MNELVLKFSSHEQDTDSFEQLSTELSQTVGDDNLEYHTIKSFNGFEDIIIILSIGGGVAIKQIGNILISWIDRNKNKKFKTKDIEITGYSSKEIRSLLKIDHDK